MNIKRTWIVASATIAVAGFAGAGVALANDDVDLRDQQPAPVMQLKGDTDDDAGRADSDSGTSARSAVSANSPSDSASDSASDSPGEPGYKAPAPAPPKAADSGNSPAPPPVARPVSVGDSGNSPASPPAADSVDSPAPAKTYRHSGDSGGSSGSADSGD